MKDLNYNSLNNALSDKGLELKHLPTSEYMEAIKLMRTLTTHFAEINEDTNTLITQYNKDHLDKAVKVKEKKEEERTEDDKAILTTPPPVTSDGRMLLGPKDFIDKVKKIQDRPVKGKPKLNFITNDEIFKSVVQNTTPENQVVLYEHLFKK